MSDNQNNLKVTIEGDNASLVAALVEAEARIKKLTEKKEDVDGLSQAFDHLGIESLAKAAIGFTTLAGAAEKALDLIMEGIKEVVNFIPESIEKTGKLAENYRQLSITAGMSVTDFNAWNATIQMSGGSAEDLNTIVLGMARGIRQHSENLVANGVFVDENALKHATLAEYIQATVEKMETLGTAEAKDQLLMDSFGRKGMTFAASLKEINEHMAEGQKQGEKYGAITEHLVNQEKELTKVKGELKVQEDLLRSSTTSATIELDIQIQKAKLQSLQMITTHTTIDRMVKDGLIPLIKTTEQFTDQNGIMSEAIVWDYTQMEEAANRYFNAIKAGKNEKIENATDAGVTIRTGHAPATGDYDKDKASKDKKAKEDAANTAKEYKKTVDDLIEAETKKNLKQTEGYEAALKSELIAKHINETDQERILTLGHQYSVQKEMDELNKKSAKEQEEAKARDIKVQNDFDKEKQSLTKISLDGITKLREDNIKENASLGIIDAEQETKQLKALYAEKYTIEKNAINERLKDNSLNVAEKQKLNNELAKLDFKYRNDDLKLTRDLQKTKQREQEQYWRIAENETSRAISSMILEHKKLGDAVKGVFQGMLNTVVDIGSKMAAEALVNGVKEALGYKTAAAAKDASSLSSATAESYAAYAYIPFAGVALAETQIAEIQTGYAASQAENLFFATGGLIDRPTMALMGEAGPELVAPKQDFMEVTKALVASGASIYHSIVKGQANQSNSVSQSSYAPSPGQFANNSPVHINMAGSINVSDSASANAMFGKIIQQTMSSYNRRYA